MKELSIIQQKLNCPKTRFNKFGNYYYRSASDILEAVKDASKGLNCSITVTDEVVYIEGKFFVKAVASVTNAEGMTISSTGWAEIPGKKAGMDEAQITGASSSYARKYALNGLFAIDDTEDNDDIASAEPKKEKKPGKTAAPKEEPKSWTFEKDGKKFSLVYGSEKYKEMLSKLAALDVEELKARIQTMAIQMKWDKGTCQLIWNEVMELNTK